MDDIKPTSRVQDAMRNASNMIRFDERALTEQAMAVNCIITSMTLAGRKEIRFNPNDMRAVHIAATAFGRISGDITEAMDADMHNPTPKVVRADMRLEAAGNALSGVQPPEEEQEDQKAA